jgi:DNA-binding CsgD family transcriptional regulator
VLRARYGLSAAETRLAARIGHGESLAAIAEAEGVVIETARSRLKAVFAKTGTHRQAELAALVARAAQGVPVQP